jgi:hypothetical protein
VIEANSNENVTPRAKLPFCHFFTSLSLSLLTRMSNTEQLTFKGSLSCLLQGYSVRFQMPRRSDDASKHQKHAEFKTAAGSVLVQYVCMHLSF